MTPTQLLAQVRAHGAQLTIREPGHLHVEASGPLPEELLFALLEHKAEIMASLCRLSPNAVLVVEEAVVWSPSDASDLVARWHAAGEPHIPLSPGITIVDLEKWLEVPRGVVLCGSWPTPADLDTVQRFLLDYAPPTPLKDDVT